MPTVGLRVATDRCTAAVNATAAVSLGGRVALDVYYTKDGDLCAAHAASGLFVEVLGDLPDGALPHVRESTE
jgi:hypothetical protein